MTPSHTTDTISGDDRGTRVVVLEGPEHFRGGERGRVIGWSPVLDGYFEVRMDLGGKFLARPGQVRGV